MADLQSMQTTSPPVARWYATQLHVAQWRQSGMLALWLLLLASLVTRLFFVATNAFSYDESHILTFGTLAAQGFAPYRQVFIGIPPLALLTVEWSSLLFQNSHWVRLPLMLTGVLAVATLFLLVRRHAPFHPIAAAAFAALFFSFNPHYFDISNTLNLEAAALCWSLLAVWAMSHYAPQRKVIWPLLSGACFALSLAYKILIPFLPGVILVQMFLAVSAQGEAQNEANRTVSASRLVALLRVGLLWLAGFIAVVAIGTLFFDPQLVYQQVIDFRLDLRDATVLEADTEVNVAEELEWLDVAQFIPLVLGAILSVPILWRKRRDALWLWGAWLLLSLLFLTTHIPLRPRHLVITLPPLAALSGIAIAGWWARMGSMHSVQKPTSARRFIRVLLIASVLVTSVSYGYLIERTAPTDNFIENQPARADVVRLVEQTTTATDCIISKENRFYLITERFPPPYLSEVSTSRLFSGKLTTDALVQEIDRHDCALLIYANSYDELAPGLREQADRYYSLELNVGDPAVEEPISVFAVPMDTTTPPANTLGVDASGFNIGEEIRLAGFDLTPGPWTQGQKVHLSTYWQTLKPPSTDYRIFIQIMDAEGQLVLSADHFPFEVDPNSQISNIELNSAYLEGTDKQLPANYPNAGMIPTQLWRPGTTLKETHPFAADLPPGAYEVRIGLYDPITGERPDVEDTAPGGVENYVALASIEVE
jgi:hypothetical protein